MDIKDICRAGGDILDAVADAVSRNDYSGLSARVGDTVSDVVSRIREEAAKGAYHKKKPVVTNCPAIAKYPAGRISGPLALAWGIFMTSGFGTTMLVMLALLAESGGSMLWFLWSWIFALLTGLGIVNIVMASRKIGLVNRFYRYAHLIGSRNAIGVEELTVQTGRKKEGVLRDLKKMMEKRMFPQGRLDDGQTTFLLTQEAYEQYMQEQRSRQEQEKQEQEAQEQTCENAEARQPDSQAARVLSDGSAYIRMVHGCSGKMQSGQMRDKLSKLETIMRRIFEHVEKHPDSADDLRKFMDYYLPTTTKLLNAYIDLDKQEIAGENIRATKKEIEDTLDIINSAFEKLLDGLFEETAWDISSDISAMKTMLAQEGLMGQKDFKL